MDKPGKPPLAQPAKGVTGREASNHLPFPTEGFLSESGGERVARGSGLAAGTGSSLQSIVFGLVGHELRIKLVESSSAHPYQPANSDVLRLCRRFARGALLGQLLLNRELPLAVFLASGSRIRDTQHVMRGRISSL